MYLNVGCLNLLYWQEICYPSNNNFGPNFDDITTFCWSGIVSIYQSSVIFGLLARCTKPLRGSFSSVLL